MAALLFIVAWGLIDLAAIREIVRTSRSEALVLSSRSSRRCTIQLEFAILVGVLCRCSSISNRTTHPRLTRCAGCRRRRSGASSPVAASDSLAACECPQLDMLRVDGSLFFGAVEHVRDELEASARGAPGARGTCC